MAGTDLQRRSIRAVAVLVAALLSLPLVACGGGDDGSEAPAPLTEDDLTRAGVEVVVDDLATPEGTGTLLLTQVQVDRMLAEQRLGGGIVGRDVDALGPMPADMPPMSFIVAAWVAVGESAAADRARDVMGERDWSQAQDVVFPTAVLAMFVADLATMVDEVEGPGEESLRPASHEIHGMAGAAAVPFERAAQETLCTDAVDFLGRTIGALFNALKLTVPPASGVFGTIANALATIWNAAVDFARGVLTAVVGAITGPVFAAIQAATAALGVAIAIVTYMKNQALTVTPSARSFHFAVGGDADVSGRFTAKARSLGDSWPPAIRNCAEAAKTTLPELVEPGAPFTWTVEEAEPVIEAARRSGTVSGDRTATLQFTTLRETDEAHREGQDGISGVRATVNIQNDGLTPFLRLAEQEFAKAVAKALEFIPPAIRDQAVAIIRGMLEPVLTRLQQEISGAAAGVFTMKGSGSVIVRFHRPPSTTTTSAPSPSTTAEPGGGSGGTDFCTEYRAMMAWALANQARPTLEAWAAEIGDRMAAMRHLVPPGLLDAFDDVAYIYALVETGANAGVLGGEMEFVGFVDDITLLNNTCGVTAGPGLG